MVVRIASRTVYKGTVTPTALNTETDVVSIPAQTEIYMVEGYIDLAALAVGDTEVVTEYINVDEVNTRVYEQLEFKDAQEKPIIRFHMKTMQNAYKVTINQTAGTLRAIPYWFVMELLEVV